MSTLRAASRYAKALLDLAREQGVLDSVKTDADFLLAVEKDSREFRSLLKSPVIKPSQKVETFKSAFSNQLSPLMVLFVNLVINHGREAHLVGILENYTDLYLSEKNIVRAFVTSAAPLTDSQRTALLAKLAAGGAANVELHEKVQPELIGGVVVRVGDRQVDATVARSLSGLKRQFENNLYIADL